MTRFYENLLGGTEDGKSPMLRAEALSEAKAWLRTRSASADPATRGEKRMSRTGQAPAPEAEFADPF